MVKSTSAPFLARLGLPLSVVVFVVVALMELIVNRWVIPAIASQAKTSTLAVAIDYIGLFLYYFASTLGVAAMVQLFNVKWSEVRFPDLRSALVRLLLIGSGLTVFFAALAVMIAPGTMVTNALNLEVLLLCAVLLALGLLEITRSHFAIGIGLLTIAAPIALTAGAALWGMFVDPEQVADPVNRTVPQTKLILLSIAAIVSPYCLGPRPLSASLVRIAPVLTAMGFATIGAIALRTAYFKTATIANRMLGVDLSLVRADRNLAFYLLALATLGWTIVANWIARDGEQVQAASRRKQIAIGLIMLVIAGATWTWPLSFMLIAVGLTLVVTELVAPAGEGASVFLRKLSDEAVRGAAMGRAIDDGIWTSYLTAAQKELATVADDVRAISSRDDDGSTIATLVFDARTEAASEAIACRLKLVREAGVLRRVEAMFGCDSADPAPLRLVQVGLPNSLLGEKVSEQVVAVGDKALVSNALAAPLPGWQIDELVGELVVLPTRGVRWSYTPVAAANEPIPIAELAAGHLHSGGRSIDATQLARTLTGLAELAARLSTSETAVANNGHESD